MPQGNLEYLHLNHMRLLNHMNLLEHLLNLCLVWAAQLTVVDASSFLSVIEEFPSSREGGDRTSDRDGSLTGLTDFETDATAPLSKLLRDQVIICCEVICWAVKCAIFRIAAFTSSSPCMRSGCTQVQFADVILLNKVDCVGAEQLQQVGLRHLTAMPIAPQHARQPPALVIETPEGCRMGAWSGAGCAAAAEPGCARAAVRAVRCGAARRAGDRTLRHVCSRRPPRVAEGLSSWSSCARACTGCDPAALCNLDQQ